MQDDIRYHSYLLRLWSDKLNSQLVWRASLESSSTGEKWGFAELDEMCAFLRQQVEKVSDTATDTGGDE